MKKKKYLLSETLQFRALQFKHEQSAKQIGQFPKETKKGREKRERKRGREGGTRKRIVKGKGQ